MKIISGGQTGVDRAALDLALSLGVDCGGWCPAGRLDEAGRIPEHYPVEELPGGGFAERTAQNVADSDGTLIIYSSTLEGGTEATRRACIEKQKPYELIDADKLSIEAATPRALAFVRERKIEVLNVAGPRAGEWAGGYDYARQVLSRILQAPHLSFVIPAHNEEHELPQALQAVRAAAEASQQRYEIIVVDDASTDTTAEVARNFGARLVTVNLRQIAAVRNAGARVAQGDVLFFVDADTQISPVHVAEALACLTSGCIGGSARFQLDRKVPFWAHVFLYLFCAMYFLFRLGIGAFIFARRADFEAVGGFDEQYFAGEEMYLTLALRKRGRFVILPHPITTSARKMSMHSGPYLFGQWLLLLLGGERRLRKRERLGIWYDGKRERRESAVAMRDKPVGHTFR